MATARVDMPRARFYRGWSGARGGVPYLVGGLDDRFPDRLIQFALGNVVHRRALF